MTIEKHDPWALLREAREELGRHKFNQESPACVLCGGESGFDAGRECLEAHDYALATRIDAALAAHDAVPPSEEKVEWKTEMGLHATTVNGVNIAVFPMTEDGRWTAALHVADPFDTLDEAQRAALSAARGIR